MAKYFCPEFKQLAVEHVLASSYELFATFAKGLGVRYSTIDK